MPAARALRKLGRDIASARRRRRIPADILAERSSISRATLHKILAGNAGVSAGAWASVLFSLGMEQRLADVADPGLDAAGLALDEERLPKRVRLRRGDKQARTKRG